MSIRDVCGKIFKFQTRALIPVSFLFVVSLLFLLIIYCTYDERGLVFVAMYEERWSQSGISKRAELFVFLTCVKKKKKEEFCQI